MLQNTSDQAIRDYLIYPSQTEKLLWQKVNIAAKEGPIRFLKRRTSASFQLHAVWYESEKGQQQECTCLVERDEAGLWQIRNVLFANTGPAQLVTEEHAITVPYLKLSGGSNAPFWASGSIYDERGEVTFVRLVTKNRLILEDDISDTLLLFLSEEYAERPIKAELYNQSHELITEQIVFPLLPEARRNI